MEGPILQGVLPPHPWVLDVNKVRQNTLVSKGLWQGLEAPTLQGVLSSHPLVLDVTKVRKVYCYGYQYRVYSHPHPPVLDVTKLRKI
jgi:hypothetical protein